LLCLDSNTRPAYTIRLDFPSTNIRVSEPDIASPGAERTIRAGPLRNLRGGCITYL